MYTSDLNVQYHNIIYEMNLFKVTWPENLSKLFWWPVVYPNKLYKFLSSSAEPLQLNLAESIFRWRPCPFPRGDNSENALMKFKKSGPISTKLGAKHPWMKAMQGCSNGGSSPFGGDDDLIEKVHWQKF